MPSTPTGDLAHFRAQHQQGTCQRRPPDEQLRLCRDYALVPPAGRSSTSTGPALRAQGEQARGPALSRGDPQCAAAECWALCSVHRLAGRCQTGFTAVTRLFPEKMCWPQKQRKRTSNLIHLPQKKHANSPNTLAVPWCQACGGACRAGFPGTPCLGDPTPPPTAWHWKQCLGTSCASLPSPGEPGPTSERPTEIPGTT